MTVRPVIMSTLAINALARGSETRMGNVQLVLRTVSLAMIKLVVIVVKSDINLMQIKENVLNAPRIAHIHMKFGGIMYKK